MEATINRTMEPKSNKNGLKLDGSPWPWLTARNLNIGNCKISLNKLKWQQYYVLLFPKRVSKFFPFLYRIHVKTWLSVMHKGQCLQEFNMLDISLGCV